jgi:hypothetical protein
MSSTLQATSPGSSDDPSCQTINDALRSIITDAATKLTVTEPSTFRARIYDPPPGTADSSHYLMIDVLTGQNDGSGDNFDSQAKNEFVSAWEEPLLQHIEKLCSDLSAQEVRPGGWGISGVHSDYNLMKAKSGPVMIGAIKRAIYPNKFRLEISVDETEQNLKPSEDAEHSAAH